MWFTYWNEPLHGVSLFWTRVATVAGIVGWACLILAVVIAPVWAFIYHATH